MNERNQELNWIRQARTGDADAFCRLYGTYRSRLYRYAFYRLSDPSDAEDAVSECVLSAWRQISTLRQPEAFPAWIFRILSGSCDKLIRAQIDRREAVSLDEAPEMTGLPHSSDRTDDWLALQEALAGLDDNERNIVLLSAVGGLKSPEIAQLTGLTAGSVRSSLSRSLKKVRGYFE